MGLGGGGTTGGIPGVSGGVSGVGVLGPMIEPGPNGLLGSRTLLGGPKTFGKPCIPLRSGGITSDFGDGATGVVGVIVGGPTYFGTWISPGIGAGRSCMIGGGTKLGS